MKSVINNGNKAHLYTLKINNCNTFGKFIYILCAFLKLLWDFPT